MFLYKNRYSILYKAITTVIVCLFLVNDIVWAQPTSYNPSNTTLAAQSRLKPFFEKHGLGFQDIAGVVMAAGELKNLIMVEKAREGPLYTKIGLLNKLFRNGVVEIEKQIKTDRFESTGKEYKYAVFYFKESQKTINVLFFEDHANLSPDELKELRINDTEKYHLDCPGLEGVWFISPTTKALTVATAQDASQKITEESVDQVFQAFKSAQQEREAWIAASELKTVLVAMIKDSPQGKWDAKIKSWIPDVVNKMVRYQDVLYRFNKYLFRYGVFQRLIKMDAVAFGKADLLEALVNLAATKAAEADDGHYISWYVIELIAEELHQKGLSVPESIYSRFKGCEQEIEQRKTYLASTDLPFYRDLASQEAQRQRTDLISKMDRFIEKVKQSSASTHTKTAGGEGPMLFIDPRKIEVRPLTEDEHRVLNDALTRLAFKSPEEGGVEFLSDETTRKLLGYDPDEIKTRAPPEVRIIDDAALLRILPDEYKYLVDGLITHAGAWRTDPLGHQHANIFLLRTVYEMLDDYVAHYERHEFLDFWRAHELKHLTEPTAPIDTELTEREKYLVKWFYGKHREEIDNQVKINREIEAGRRYAAPAQENAEDRKTADVLGGFSEYTEAFELERFFYSVGATETAVKVLEERLSNPHLKNSDVIKEYEVQRELMKDPLSLKALNELLRRLHGVLGELQGEVRSREESQSSNDAMTERFKRLLYPETGELPALLKELDALLARYSNPHAVKLKEAVSQSLKDYVALFSAENEIFKRHEYEWSPFSRGLYSNAPKLSLSQHEFLNRLNNAVGEIAASAILATLRVEHGYKEAVFTTGGPLFTMQNAIHPTLKIKDKFEPVSFTVPEEGKAVLISGLHTGGKSVTLKTAGIIALMVQCGMPVPADVTMDEGMFAGFVKPDISHYDVDIGEASRFAAELVASGRLIQGLSPRTLVIIDDDIFGGSSEPAVVASCLSATVEELSKRKISVIAVTHHIDALEALKARNPDFIFKRIKTRPGQDGMDVSTRSLEDGIAGSSLGLNETIRQKWPAAARAVAFYNIMSKKRNEAELSYQGAIPSRANKPARYRGFFYSNAERTNLQADQFKDTLSDVAAAILGKGCAYNIEEFASLMMRKPEACDGPAWRASIERLRLQPGTLRLLDEKLRANMPEWEYKVARSDYSLDTRTDFIVDEDKIAVKRFLDLVDFAAKSDIPLISENSQAIQLFIDDKAISATFMRYVESYGLAGAINKVYGEYSGPEKEAEIAIVNNIRSLFGISALAHISWPFAASTGKRGKIDIKGGWHSVLTKDPLRTPNDIAIGLKSQNDSEGSLTIYTGFNTGGKSTLAKMIAQIVTLARMGWPVPAASATIGDFSDIQVVSGTLTEDKQEVRSRRHKTAIGGALASALHESALVLQSATSKSLVILDEPFSGCTEPSVSMALTAALAEDLVKKGATVILITHLLEAVPLLTERIPYARAFKAKTVERDGLTVPLYLFEPGVALSSHGFEVARGMKWPGYERALSYFELLSKTVQELAPDGLSERSADSIAAARAEADRVHAANLSYTPNIPDKTILCHIVADSILPDAQKGVLNALEIAMREKSYSEKIVALRVDSSKDFIREVMDTIKRVEDYYRAEYGEEYKNYTFKFDIACPAADGLVERVRNELYIPALAFSRKEGDIIQVEGIMLALRALGSGEIDKLRAAFKFINGEELPPELLKIDDINELARRIIFILPSARAVNYEEIKELNDIIRKNIETAA